MKRKVLPVEAKQSPVYVFKDGDKVTPIGAFDPHYGKVGIIRGDTQAHEAANVQFPNSPLRAFVQLGNLRLVVGAK